MSRRLLLLLAGFGGAVVAAVLWSGTAYASSPRPLVAAPRVAGAIGRALPPPDAQPVSLPPLPKPATSTVVGPVVETVSPVVTHTVTRVREAVPVLATVLPAPSAAATQHAPVVPAHHAIARSTTAPHRRAALRVSLVATAHRTHSKAHAPAHATHHHRSSVPLPLGLADGPSGPARGGSGSPFAVTARAGRHAPDRWSHAFDVLAREPAMVVLRDIARPG